MISYLFSCEREKKEVGNQRISKTIYLKMLTSLNSYNRKSLIIYFKHGIGIELRKIYSNKNYITLSCHGHHGLIELYALIAIDVKIMLKVNSIFVCEKCLFYFIFYFCSYVFCTYWIENSIIAMSSIFKCTFSAWQKSVNLFIMSMGETTEAHFQSIWILSLTLKITST